MSDGVSEVRKVVHASVAELRSKTADQDQLCQSLNQQLEDFTRKHDEHVGSSMRIQRRSKVLQTAVLDEKTRCRKGFSGRSAFQNSRPG